MSLLMTPNQDTPWPPAGYVAISPVLAVPLTFTEYVAVEDQHGRRIATATVTVQLVAGKEQLDTITFEGSLAPAQLRAVDWSALLQQALLIRAMKETTVNLAAHRDDDRLAEFITSDLIASLPRLGTTRTYNRMRYEDYERVASAWRSGGPEAVSDQFHVSLRQANRYVARAKEHGLL
jgi:hypothetical protein